MLQKIPMPRRVRRHREGCKRFAPRRVSLELQPRINPTVVLRPEAQSRAPGARGRPCDARLSVHRRPCPPMHRRGHRRSRDRRAQPCECLPNCAPNKPWEECDRLGEAPDNAAYGLGEKLPSPTDRPRRSVRWGSRLGARGARGCGVAGAYHFDACSMCGTDGEAQRRNVAVVDASARHVSLCCAQTIARLRAVQVVLCAAGRRTVKTQRTKAVRPAIKRL